MEFDRVNCVVSQLVRCEMSGLEVVPPSLEELFLGQYDTADTEPADTADTEPATR